MNTRLVSHLCRVVVWLFCWGAGASSTWAQKLPEGISAIERQLNEWRTKSAFWVEEAARAYPNDPGALVELKEHYVNAAAIANSLIDQLQLQIVSGSPLSVKQYAPDVERAKTASEALVIEGRRLLVKARGKSRGEDPATTALLKSAAETVTVAGGVLEILDKHSKAFMEVKTRQREEVRKLLEQRRWKPLSALLPPSREPKP